ncbi:MAG: hypothetical protein Altm2KO_20290 [Alteromonas macleodii]|jgi:hypothetical protein|uniref:hypothetical protein n=2 Tax=Alteromonas TaxID=226 RepID=UPI00079B931D|nr:hypothetical protein [Alteromonas macleodii]KXJ60225.1 MAG: hypothetical protein AXW14_13300 [Alteromonas sp. Nap_26]MDM7962172.1 hypothetical protein [Alteromonas macleodii]MDM8170905.1 hypothetical protein [Alteromonas macleodii]CAI3967585.1 hypothetical protein EZ55_03560 [Alteromonas macleodii]VTP57472.1 hypothetical protein EZ55_03560 [Alteromonas macleodii]|tara:strand:- start:5826 stop:6599 length:774 start_codon:yes stop_codon:yes gene_type:complete
MKIGVIGNSHLAAFKLGWSEIRNQYPDLELTFFGSPASSMRFFKVENGCLTPTKTDLADNLSWTSDGMRHIPGDMDAYILVGMGFSLVHMLALLKEHRTFEYFKDCEGDKQLISDSFLLAALDGILNNSNAIQIIKLLQEISTAPIAYSPNPLPADSVLGDTEYDYYHLAGLLDKCYSHYINGCSSLFSESAVIFAHQPPCTIVDKMFTSQNYSKGSVKLKRGMQSIHNSNDHFHMNAEFGALSLQDLFEKLRVKAS